MLKFNEFKSESSPTVWVYINSLEDSSEPKLKKKVSNIMCQTDSHELLEVSHETDWHSSYA